MSIDLLTTLILALVTIATSIDTSRSISTNSGYPFSLTRVDAAYPYTKGKGVKICMVDTYVDIFHKSLRGKAITAPLPPSSEAAKHGTEIAGIIIGNDPEIGIAPEVSLYVAPAFGTPEKRGTAADVAQAIDECINIT